MENKLKKRKFKVPYATKHKEKKLPSEKVPLSSAEMDNTTEQRNTMLGKSVSDANEEKLCADNIIPINILNRPSPLKENSYNEFERSGRLSRNRVRDTKGTHYFCIYLFMLVSMIHLPIFIFLSY